MIAIKEQLRNYADEEYAKFMSSLTPGKDNIIGVRLPILRKMAKQIAKGNYEEYLKEVTCDTYEEVMLTGMVIGYIKTDIEELLTLVREYIPLIDNWAVCDSFCSGLKITKFHKERVWNFLCPYLYSDKEFEVRFAVIMILNYYVDSYYATQAFHHFDKIKHDGYYVKMAIAWAISVFYTKLPDLTLEYIKNNNLDDFTHNKAIQKIRESLRVDKETKDMIKSYKRN